MSITIRDNLRGLLKIDNLPEGVCFTSFQDLLRALPEFLTVEIPRSVSGIVVSSTQPSEDDRDKFWLFRDNAGNIHGLFLFQNGKWFPYVTEIPNVIKIEWVSGDSNTIPDGWRLVEAGEPLLPSSVVSHIIGQYVPGSGNFLYFAIIFVGY